MRASIRRYYWQNNWFRRTCNTLKPQWPVVVLLAAWFVTDWFRTVSHAEQINSMARAYTGAMDHSSKLNEELRLAYEEQKALRQEVRICKERQ